MPEKDPSSKNKDSSKQMTGPEMKRAFDELLKSTGVSDKSTQTGRSEQMQDKVYDLMDLIIPQDAGPEDNGGVKITDRIQRFSQQERSTLARAACTLPEISGEPQSWRAHMDTQKIIYVIHALDSSIAQELMTKGIGHLKKAIQIVNAEIFPKMEKDPSYAYNQKMQRVYYLLSLQTNEQGIAVCREAMSRLEKEMITHLGSKQIIELLRYEENSMAQQQKDVEGNAELTMDKLWQLLPVALPESLRNKFTCHDHRILYRTTIGKQPSAWDLTVNGAEIVMRNTENPKALLASKYRNFLDAIEKDALDPLLSRALDDEKSEREGRKDLELAELPEGDVLHLRLFPKKYDVILANELRDAAFLSAAMQHRYGARLKERPIIFSDHPKEALTAEIERGRAEGIRAVCIDTFSHGSTDKFVFETSFTTADLADVSRLFPDCTLFFGSPACYGAGTRKGMEQAYRADPSLASRLHVFMQSKPDMPTPNVTFGDENGKRQHRATMHYSHMIRGFFENDDITYGKVFSDADESVKEKFHSDAEAHWRGNLIARRTMQAKEKSNNIT
ncbi:MAG: hypothetical protein V1926_04960 [Candidatus Peregrinibacteria bacterium]